MKIRRKDKRILGLIGATAYMTGFGLFLFSRFIRVASSVGEQRHPMEYGFRLSHTALTYLVVLGLGYLIKGHVVPGLKSKTRRRFISGLGVLSALGILIVTALALLYGGEGRTTEILNEVHTYLGLALPLGLVAHIYGHLRAEKRRAESP